MEILERHSDVLSRELPGEDPADLVVHRGQFHEVVIGADRVVCFARTAAAATRLPERTSVLRTVADLELGFRTPVPLSEVAGLQSYLVLSRMPGAPLDGAALDDPSVLAVAAAEFAALLTGLARVGRHGAARVDLPTSSPERWQKFAARVRAELFPLMSEEGRARATAELADLRMLPHLTSAVVHGDLGGENVLWEWVDGLPRLVGVVHWDEVMLGDQAEDLAAIQAS